MPSTWLKTNDGGLLSKLSWDNFSFRMRHGSLGKHNKKKEHLDSEKLVAERMESHFLAMQLVRGPYKPLYKELYLLNTKTKETAFATFTFKLW